jgi:hypothetical protein
MYIKHFQDWAAIKAAKQGSLHWWLWPQKGCRRASCESHDVFVTNLATDTFEDHCTLPGNIPLAIISVMSHRRCRCSKPAGTSERICTLRVELR